MSIPPKYGRVYTRINGGVSCKAITFPFLRFRCAREGKGSESADARVRGEGRQRDERQRERESGEEADRARYEEGWGTNGRSASHLHLRTRGTRDFMRGFGTCALRDRTISPASITAGY